MTAARQTMTMLKDDMAGEESGEKSVLGSSAGGGQPTFGGSLPRCTEKLDPRQKRRATPGYEWRELDTGRFSPAFPRQSNAYLRLSFWFENKAKLCGPRLIGGTHPRFAD